MAVDNHLQDIKILEERPGLFNEFISEISNSNYVICGERHGSIENILIYKHLLQTQAFGAFAYELFDTWQNGIQNYISKKSQYLAPLLHTGKKWSVKIVPME